MWRTLEGRACVTVSLGECSLWSISQMEGMGKLPDAMG